MEQAIHRRQRPTRALRAWGITILAAGFIAASPGCATLRGKRDNSEAIGACRQLSREGVAALEHGDAARAQLLLDQAVEANGNDVDARRQLADVLWQSGNAAEAMIHIDRAVELDSQHAPTIVRSGEMRLGLGDSDGALHRADESLLLDPTLAGAWSLRGRVFRAKGQYERALADYHQALRFNPHATEVLLEAAEVQYQLGRPQRSLTTLQNLLQSYPPGEEPRRALWLEGLAFSAVNRPEDAVEALYAASGRGPAEPELLYQLARAQSAAGQAVDAAATAQLAADAGHQGSVTFLAQLRAESAAGGTVLR
jgi:tetratricopeptide (TPR) repeat protein